MTLKDCTKDELIFVIERLKFYGFTAGDHYIRRALNDVEMQREDRKFEQSRQLREQAQKKFEEYSDLVRAYEGKPISDIPAGIMNKAAAIAREYDELNRKWLKVAGIK